MSISSLPPRYQATLTPVSRFASRQQSKTTHPLDQVQFGNTQVTPENIQQQIRQAITEHARHVNIAALTSESFLDDSGFDEIDKSEIALAVLDQNKVATPNAKVLSTSLQRAMTLQDLTTIIMELVKSKRG